MKDEARVDILHGGKAVGGVAQRLLASGFNVNALRTNETLLYDEWKIIDEAVIRVAQERLVITGDLSSRGLTYNIPNGMSKTVLGWQTMSDLNDAEMTMDGVSRGRRDRPEYDIAYMPLPIIHKDFSFSVREIQESRNGSMPLDTTSAEMSTLKVTQLVEQIVFQGYGGYTFKGGSVYGILDTPWKVTGSLTKAWDDPSATGEEIVGDVLAMKNALLQQRRYGPYALYIPPRFEKKMDEDYVANYPKTIRSRIMEISNIEIMQVADFLTDTNVTMTQLSSDVIRMVNGMPITTVQWEAEGGMRVNFKVMVIALPNIRETQENEYGVAVYA